MENKITFKQHNPKDKCKCGHFAYEHMELGLLLGSCSIGNCDCNEFRLEGEGK